MNKLSFLLIYQVKMVSSLTHASVITLLMANIVQRISILQIYVNFHGRETMHARRGHLLIRVRNHACSPGAPLNKGDRRGGPTTFRSHLSKFLSALDRLFLFLSALGILGSNFSFVLSRAIN